MADALEIRALTRGEFDTAIAWAAGEGWNPGLADGDPFHSTDTEGFIGAWLGGQMIACISAVRYGPSFGFIGFYICDPLFRGQGYGWPTWQAGMAHLGDRTIGLDGVIGQQDNYRKSGFELVHRSVRYGGDVTCDAPQDPRLCEISSDLLDAVVAYDQDFFAGPRQGFTSAWVTPTDTRIGIALIDDGAITGYGVIRDCREGCKVGPLFADSEAGADLLFRALVSRAGGGAIYLDPPEPNKSAIALAERYAMAPVFETARMYRGADPGLPLARTFGITTFELG